MRATIKGAAERVLVWSGLARYARSRMRGRTLILAYHDVTPDHGRASGDGSLHLPQRDFARQLDALLETHDVVPLSSIVSGLGNTSRPRAVLTFDDAYAGALDTGVAELARRGLPATIFVAPGLLGRATWWDLLAHGDGAVPEAARRHALQLLAGRGDAVLQWAAEQGMSRAVDGDVPRIATESELAIAAEVPGITLGAHTWSHVNLAVIAGAELELELARPLAWLRARFPRATIPWLAYPYGCWSPSVERAAAGAGYAGALRVEGGWVTDAERPHAVPRLNVPNGLSLDGFRLRISGIGA